MLWHRKYEVRYVYLSLDLCHLSSTNSVPKTVISLLIFAFSAGQAFMQASAQASVTQTLAFGNIAMQRVHNVQTFTATKGCLQPGTPWVVLDGFGERRMGSIGARGKGDKANKVDQSQYTVHSAWTVLRTSKPWATRCNQYQPTTLTKGFFHRSGPSRHYPLTWYASYIPWGWWTYPPASPLVLEPSQPTGLHPIHSWWFFFENLRPFIRRR